MNIQFVRDPQHHYLEIRTEKKIDPESYETRILLSGTCSRLLRCSMHHTDNVTVLRYDISSMKPLQIAFAGLRPDHSMLALTLGSIASGMLELSDCLLDPSHVLLDPSALFLDMRDHSVFFVYVPWEREEFIPAFGNLLLSFFGQCAPDDDLAALLLFRLYRRCLDESICPELILHSLTEEYEKGTAAAVSKGSFDTQPAESIGPEPARQIRQAAPAPSDLLSVPDLSMYGEDDPSGKRKKTGFLGRLFKGMKKQEISEDSSAMQDLLPEEDPEPDVPWPLRDGAVPAVSIPENITTGSSALTENDGYTTILHERKAEGPALIPAEKGSFPVILIEKKELTIGKQAGAVDFVLPHPAVSRLHARITVKGGLYYIEDLCSKNGTFLNGTLLPANEAHIIKSGDSLRFAALNYKVRLN